MDQPQYSTVLDALAAIPDPRQARGKQLEWVFILGVIASALLSQQRSVAAMAQWAHEHAEALIVAFRPQRKRVPSEATIRRALRQVDIRHVEAHLARLQVRPPRPPTKARVRRLQGYAVDGKYVRGAGTHGQRTLLVSLVQHGDAHVLTQRTVALHQHEGKAITQLLAGRDLRGMVVTLDAGLTDPKLARHILAQGGHYLMVVKRNQAQLYQDLVWYFDTPPLPCDRPWRTHRALTKGHGRLEDRHLNCRDDLHEYLTWPGVQQVLQRTCERIVLKTGSVTHATSYALTSIPAADATARELAAWWRGHWTIENKVHYVRDVTLGEDAHQMYTGGAPQVLAALRNTVLNQVRAAGWTNIASALRHYSASVANALLFLGVTPIRL
jgi:predicted transposase YbfD/YdcC